MIRNHTSHNNHSSNYLHPATPPSNGYLQKTPWIVLVLSQQSNASGLFRITAQQSAKPIAGLTPSQPTQLLQTQPIADAEELTNKAVATGGASAKAAPNVSIAPASGSRSTRRVNAAAPSTQHARTPDPWRCVSVSEVAYAMIDTAADDEEVDDDYMVLVDSIRKLRDVNSISFFARHVKDYRKHWRGLIFKIISSANIIVGTPTAAKKIADNKEIDFKPLIVWSDEAGRVSEASGLAAITFFPEALLRSLTGDPFQGHLMTSSGAGRFRPKDSEGYFTNQFVPCPVSQLRITHRMHGDLEIFLSRQFYRNKMTSANDILPEEVERVRQSLQLYGRDTAESMLMLDMKSTTEEKEDTSFLNRTNAGLVVRMVINVFKQQLCAINPTDSTPGKRARVIVIAPYAAQRRLYNELFAKVSDAEFVRELVEIRTIPLVQGHEAEIVIFDTVRTTSIGFLAEHENANVCLTRAKYALIVVGSLACWSGSSAGPFQNLKSYVYHASCVRSYKTPKFALDCARCHQDHDTKDCKWQVDCAMCPEQPGHHHIRDCKKEPVKMSAEFPIGHTLCHIGDDKWAKREITRSKKVAANSCMRQLVHGSAAVADSNDTEQPEKTAQQQLAQFYTDQVRKDEEEKGENGHESEEDH
ncbi:SEN1 N terminal-domain-containing protein [Apiospora aurea]|uniref:SEN1 N terminal-domain-containing protein n=1 Tax=Apiospora aurea TaxID=335848 RepID=A0ABR1R0G1_9PEZI